MTDTKWMPKNLYDAEPEANTDEDGEEAYVRVTRSTETADEARAWLVAHPEAIMMEPTLERLVPEQMACKGIYGHVDSMRELHDGVALRSLTVSGAATCWWRFQVYGAVEELPGADDGWQERAARRSEEYAAEQRRRAAEWVGPWWWRARVRVARVLSSWGSRLDPEDRTSASWLDPTGRNFVMVEDLRRPPDEGAGG